MAQKHRFEIALEFALKRTHSLQPQKDFRIESRIGGGNNTMKVVLIGRKAEDYKVSLEEIAAREKFELELLQEAA